MKVPVTFLLFTLCAAAEVRTMTFRQALDRALESNPDVVLSRLDQVKSRAQVAIAGDAFNPKVYAGSGLAYTNGFPTSIDGNAPSIVQAKTQMSLFDRSQSYKVAQAQEATRGTQLDIELKQQDVAYRVASLFLDAGQMAQRLEAVQRQADILVNTKALIDARVAEDRELAIGSKRAAVDIQRARKRVEDLSADLENVETSLAQVLGFSADDRVRPVREDRILPVLPESEAQLIEKAIENSREIKRLESDLQAKTLEEKSYRAMRLPKVDLVAQWALLGKYNNYDQYFQRFQRNNLELGASIQVPVLMSRAGKAYLTQEQADIDKIRLEIGRTRDRIKIDVQRAESDVKRAESARDLARADLDLAREQLTIDLAQYDEGRLPMTQVEVSRIAEQEKWLAYYGSQHDVEAARLNVLRQSGTLLAALQ